MIKEDQTFHGKYEKDELQQHGGTRVNVGGLGVAVRTTMPGRKQVEEKWRKEDKDRCLRMFHELKETLWTSQGSEGKTDGTSARNKTDTPVADLKNEGKSSALNQPNHRPPSNQGVNKSLTYNDDTPWNIYKK